MKERRAGATMGAPRGCPGVPCARLRRGRHGRTETAVAAGPARCGFKPGAEARCFALGFEVLSVCLSSAEARSVRSAALPGSASAFGGSVALWRTGFFDLRFLRLSRAPAGRDASHLGVSLTSVPLASPMALSQGRLPRRSRAGESHLRRGSRRLPRPRPGTRWGGRGSRPPPSTSVRVCFPLRTAGAVNK